MNTKTSPPPLPSNGSACLATYLGKSLSACPVGDINISKAAVSSLLNIASSSPMKISNNNKTIPHLGQININQPANDINKEITKIISTAELYDIPKDITTLDQAGKIQDLDKLINIANIPDHIKHSFNYSLTNNIAKPSNVISDVIDIEQSALKYNTNSI